VENLQTRKKRTKNQLIKTMMTKTEKLTLDYPLQPNLKLNYAQRQNKRNKLKNKKPCKLKLSINNNKRLKKRRRKKLMLLQSMKVIENKELI
jgi:hypothetical protein